MKIDCAYDELLDINDPRIIPNPKNPNFHSFDQIERLSKIIDYQGQRSPIVISKRSGFVVIGHGRLQSIQKLGWEKIAVNFQDFKNEAQEYSHLVADNSIAEWAEMDKFKILEEVELLRQEELDFDLELLGIDNFNVLDEKVNGDDSDSESEDEGKNEKPKDAVIKITCKQDLKDEVLIYLKAKLMETSFEGVHIE